MGDVGIWCSATGPSPRTTGPALPWPQRPARRKMAAYVTSKGSRRYEGHHGHVSNKHTDALSVEKGGGEERMLLTIWNECRCITILSRIYSLFAKRKSSWAVVSSFFAASSRHWERRSASERESDTMSMNHRDEPLPTALGACIIQHLRQISRINRKAGQSVRELTGSKLLKISMRASDLTCFSSIVV